MTAEDGRRKEAWSFYETVSGVRLCWELEEPKGPKERVRPPVRVEGLESAFAGDPANLQASCSEFRIQGFRFRVEV